MRRVRPGPGNGDCRGRGYRVRRVVAGRGSRGAGRAPELPENPPGTTFLRVRALSLRHAAPITSAQLVCTEALGSAMSTRVNSLWGRQKCRTDLFVQTPVALGFAHIDGYFLVRRYDSASASVSFQPRSFNAQTTSGDLQSGAGTAPHRERSNRLAPELSVLRRENRARAQSCSAPAAFARHAEMQRVRTHSPIHRGSRLTDRPTRRSVSPCSCTRSNDECTSILFSRESQPEASLY